MYLRIDQFLHINGSGNAINDIAKDNVNGGHGGTRQNGKDTSQAKLDFIARGRKLKQGRKGSGWKRGRLGLAGGGFGRRRRMTTAVQCISIIIIVILSNRRPTIGKTLIARQMPNALIQFHIVR